MKYNIFSFAHLFSISLCALFIGCTEPKESPKDTLINERAEQKITELTNEQIALFFNSFPKVFINSSLTEGTFIFESLRLTKVGTSWKLMSPADSLPFGFTKNGLHFSYNGDYDIRFCKRQSEVLAIINAQSTNDFFTDNAILILKNSTPDKPSWEKSNKKLKAFLFDNYYQYQITSEHAQGGTTEGTFVYSIRDSGIFIQPNRGFLKIAEADAPKRLIFSLPDSIVRKDAFIRFEQL
jgi:hypothetical protein